MAITAALPALLLALLAAQDTAYAAGKAKYSPCSLYDETSFILFSKRVVTPEGVIPAAVLVEDGKIKAVRKVTSASEAAPFLDDSLPILDYSNAVISPGLVDVHVHLNEPGRVEWEGVVTGTEAAAAGGVTTIVEMPLNSMPTVISKDTFQQKLDAVAGKLMVDMGFWGGLVPENANDLQRLEEMLRAGVLGLKSFMSPSGIDDFPATNGDHFKAALPLLAKYGLPLLVHAEVPLPLNGPANGDPRVYKTYEATRPPAWEREAIRQALEAFAGTAPGGPHAGAHLHIVHLSDASSVNLIEEAKAAGTDVTVETCPHYLAFSNKDVPDGDTRFKCAPPIRSSANRKALWKALKAGKVDMLSSDHSPCEPELKLLTTSGDFLKAWGGISGLQLSLPVTWTHGQKYNVTLLEMAQWWSARPAALANLGSKGEISVGKDADFVVWSPETSFKVIPGLMIFHKHKVTPYANDELSGEIVATFVRGQLVYQQGQHADKPCGRILLAP